MFSLSQVTLPSSNQSLRLAVRLTEAGINVGHMHTLADSETHGSGPGLTDHCKTSCSSTVRQEKQAPVEWSCRTKRKIRLEKQWQREGKERRKRLSQGVRQKGADTGSK